MTNNDFSQPSSAETVYISTPSLLFYYFITSFTEYHNATDACASDKKIQAQFCLNCYPSTLQYTQWLEWMPNTDCQEIYLLTMNWYPFQSATYLLWPLNVLPMSFHSSSSTLHFPSHLLMMNSAASVHILDLVVLHYDYLQKLSREIGRRKCICWCATSCDWWSHHGS